MKHALGRDLELDEVETQGNQLFFSQSLWLSYNFLNPTDGFGRNQETVEQSG
jgi:hypothetical protein